MREAIVAELYIDGGEVKAKCPTCNIITSISDGLLNIKVKNGVFSEVYAGGKLTLLACGHKFEVSPLDYKSGE